MKWSNFNSHMFQLQEPPELSELLLHLGQLLRLLLPVPQTEFHALLFHTDRPGKSQSVSRPRTGCPKRGGSVSGWVLSQFLRATSHVIFLFLLFCLVTHRDDEGKVLDSRSYNIDLNTGESWYMKSRSSDGRKQSLYYATLLKISKVNQTRMLLSLD